MHLYTKFDTTIVPASDRFGYWHDVVCGRFVPASSLDKSQNDFDASLVTRAVGPLEISHFRAPPHFWSREKKHISAEDDDDILLSILLSGSGALEQDGRTVVQRQHEIVLYDTSQAFRYDLTSEVFLMKIPRRLLASRYTNLRSLMAVGVRTDLSLNALLMDLATRTMLLDVPEDSWTTVGARLASSVLDLVSAVIDLEIEERGALNHQRMSQLERAQRYAVANLGDENLSPEAGQAGRSFAPNTEQAVCQNRYYAHALGLAAAASGQSFCSFGRLRNERNGRGVSIWFQRGLAFQQKLQGSVWCVSGAASKGAESRLAFLRVS